MNKIKINWRDPILLVILAAFLYRLVGVGWGLPNEMRAISLHPDEQVNLLVSRQGIEPGKLDFTPGFYNYGTLYFTFLRFISDIVGVYSGGFDAQGQLTPAGMGSVHLVARVFNCLFGAITCGLVFAIGRRFLTKVGAGFAAAACVVAPALVVHSRFQTVDALATMFAVSCLYWCIRGLDSHEPLRRAALWAGVFAGLSAGTKYVGFAAVLALLPVFALRGKSENAGEQREVVSWVMLPAALFACLVVFLITTPGAILEREAFIRDFTFELNHSKEGHGIVFAQTAPAFLYHLGNLWLGFSLIGLLVGLYAFARGALLKSAPIIVCAVFFVLMYGAVSGGQIKFMRYILPTIPALALGLGYFIDLVREKSELGKRVGVVVGLAVVGGLDKSGFVASGTMTAQMLAVDPRDLAGRFLKDKGEVGLVSDPWFWSATLHPEMPMTRMFGPKRLMEMWSGWTSPKVVRFMPENPTERYDWDKRLISDLKPEYISFSSFEYGPVQRIADSKGGSDVEKLFASRYSEFVEELGKTYEIVPGPWDDGLGHRLMVEDMEYIHPRVTIWKRKTP
ncbi:MAG: glycosyltransferase family 39 protein [Fimbriimonas sp.]|nr:glycosyltransferase family 39 protein [Fimbriimonas sp.]